VTLSQRAGSSTPDTTGVHRVTTPWRSLPLELLLLFGMFVAYRAW
jgi:hypothetical protein